MDSAVSTIPAPVNPARTDASAATHEPLQAYDVAGRWTVQPHDSLASTSDEARRLAASGAAHGTTVWARTQTAGRGRRGRTWSSPEGNLHMSVVLRCAVPEIASQLGFVAALAVADVVDEALGRARTRLKWPNDVLLDGAKLAGLLLEMECGAVVLGIGVNLRHFPIDAGYAATSLHAHGVETTAGMMLHQVLHSLGTRLDEWHESGFDHIQANWSKRGHQRGDAIRIGTEEGLVDARYVGLDCGGFLLAMVDGRVVSFTCGEIMLD